MLVQGVVLDGLVSHLGSSGGGERGVEMVPFATYS